MGVMGTVCVGAELSGRRVNTCASCCSEGASTALGSSTGAGGAGTGTKPDEEAAAGDALCCWNTGASATGLKESKST